MAGRQVTKNVFQIRKDSPIMRTVDHIDESLSRFAEIQLSCAGTAIEKAILVAERCVQEGVAEYSRFTSGLVPFQNKEMLYYTIKLRRPLKAHKAQSKKPINEQRPTDKKPVHKQKGTQQQKRRQNQGPYNEKVKQRQQVNYKKQSYNDDHRERNERRERDNYREKNERGNNYGQQKGNQQQRRNENERNKEREHR